MSLVERGACPKSVVHLKPLVSKTINVGFATGTICLTLVRPGQRLALAEPQPLVLLVTPVCSDN